MTVEKTTWDLAKQVFLDALEWEGEARDQVVREGCGDDQALLAQVEALLAGHQDAGDFLGEVTLLPVGDGLPLSSDLAESDEAMRDERFRALQTFLAGRYSFEGELGRGGMGVVYLARDVSLDRPVAIKLLASDLGGRKEARERFLLEARTSARLSHPNIVPVHAVEEHGDLLYFVMAFVDGETVGERVRRTGPMAVGEVSRILQDVSWALDYAHGRGVIHRDIKPDNIILERGTGRAVVTDFGIAKAGLSAGLTTEGALLGTPEYVSPEQALGNEVDGRSDVYSLGVTCFFALTGRLPFEADGVQGVLAKHVQEPPSSVLLFRPDLPRKVARAIDQCLAKDPRDRFGTAEELAEAVGDARAQVVEVPAPLREIRGEAELLVMDGFGFGTLSIMAWLGWVKPDDYWEFLSGNYLNWGETVSFGISVAVWLLTIGLVGSRFVQLIRRSRFAVVQGYSVQHLGNAFLESTLQSEGRTRGDEQKGMPPVLEASALGATLVLLTLGWVFVWELQPSELPGWLGLGAWALVMFLLATPVLVGRTLGARVVRNWPGTRRLWGLIWRGRLGDLVYKLASIGLSESGQPISANQPTEALIAGAAADIFRGLPPEYQARLVEVPDLVRRLEGSADALRRREAELERVLSSVGTVGSTIDRRLAEHGREGQRNGLGSVREHRSRAAEDLQSARKMVGGRLTAAVAALENLRLGLLRLKAGVGSPDEMTADLRTAREIGEEVQAILDGEHQVAGLLSAVPAKTDRSTTNKPDPGGGVE